MQLGDAVNHACEGRLKNFGEADLLDMLKVCLSARAGNDAEGNRLKAAISLIQSELDSQKIEKRHKEMIAEQERLHEAQNVFAERLNNKSSAEEAARHKKTQCVAWLAAGIGFLSLVVGGFALYFQITSKPDLLLEKSQPAITSTLPQAAPQLVSTNAPLTNSVISTTEPTNQPAPELPPK